MANGNAKVFMNNYILSKQVIVLETNTFPLIFDNQLDF